MKDTRPETVRRPFSERNKQHLAVARFHVIAAMGQFKEDYDPKNCKKRVELLDRIMDDLDMVVCV